jgi:hypothetical protein
VAGWAEEEGEGRTHSGECDREEDHEEDAVGVSHPTRGEEEQGPPGHGKVAMDSFGSELRGVGCGC